MNAYLSPCKECIATRTTSDTHPLWEDPDAFVHLVYVEGKQAPKVKHPSLDEAKREAERLAKFTREKVYVVKVVATCTTETITKWEGA